MNIEINKLEKSSHETEMFNFDNVLTSVNIAMSADVVVSRTSIESFIREFEHTANIEDLNPLILIFNVDFSRDLAADFAVNDVAYINMFGTPDKDSKVSFNRRISWIQLFAHYSSVSNKEFIPTMEDFIVYLLSQDQLYASESMISDISLSLDHRYLEESISIDLGNIELNDVSIYG